jgi:hypothetical protein
MVIFIECVPTAPVAASQLHVPPVPPDQLHDVVPVSNDPLGTTLATLAGYSRYTNPDVTAPDAYSTPFDCRLLT